MNGYVKLKNIELAKAFLSQVDIDTTDDYLLLQIYLDLCELSAPRRLDLINRIIRYTKEKSQLLQYHTLKAIHMIMMGDRDEGLNILNKAIMKYTPSDAGKPDVYYQNMCARAYAEKWHLTRDPMDLELALKYYQGISYETLTTKGELNIYEEIARLLKDAERYNDAIIYFEKMLIEGSTQSGKIHLAETYVRIDQIDKAKAILDELAKSGIVDICKFEYLQVKGLLGLTTRDRELTLATIHEMQSMDIKELYFQNTRNALCIEMLNMINASDVENEDNRRTGVFELIWEKVRIYCQYLILKPSIFGLGFDVNRMIGEPRKK